MAELASTGGSAAFGATRQGVPALDPQAMRGAKPVSTNDEVAAILKGLKLDRQFFTEKLNGDFLKGLAPQDPQGAEQQGTMQRQISRDSKASRGTSVGVTSRLSDFDVYLNEAMMPVLAQALDALCRQIVRMEKQGSTLDKKVRDRFNPITWLAQQLLRRHPRAATTPRRMHIYRNFRDWADYERGRRELLRCKGQVQEVFNGFMQRGKVGRNSLPSVLSAVDDIFYVRGVLKDHKDIKRDFIMDGEQAPQPAAHAGGRSAPRRRTSCLGGEGVSFEQFWYKFANTIMKNDIITFSAIQDGRRLQQLEEEENAMREEAAKKEEERRQREAEEHQRLLGLYQVLYPKMLESEGLKEILDGKVLTGDFLKPTDPGFLLEVTPHGPHVALLEEMLILLGFETKPEREDLGDGRRPSDGGRKLFRPKLKHDVKAADKGKEKEKEKEEPKAAAKSKGGRKASKGAQKEEKKEKPAEEKATDGAPKIEGPDRWYEPELKAAWVVLQELHRAEPDGIVECKVLQEVMTPPENFVTLKRKVESEFETRAESAENGEDKDLLLDMVAKAGGKEKPTLEELAKRCKMTRARLDFFHDLFESFLPQTADGSPGACLYPECPASIDKMTMFTLLGELQPGLGKAEFEARFRRIDKDHSGLIEFDEFVQWIYEDEVQIIGASKKMTFEELASSWNISVELVKYIYACFSDEMPEDQVDEYPAKCERLPQAQAWSLAGILTPSVQKKDFDRDFAVIDVEKQGGLHFDEFLELLDFAELPSELREKYGC